MQCLVCGSEILGIEALTRGTKIDRREAVCKECNQRYRTETRIVALLDTSGVVSVDDAAKLIEEKTEKYITGIRKRIEKRKNRSGQGELW